MKGMKSMKAMKAMKAPAMSASAAYTSVAEQLELKPGEVKSVVEAYFALAGKELKSSESFKIGGFLNLKLKKKPAQKKRKGINPFTGEEQWFKARPASKTVRALPMKALKEMLN